MDDGMDAMLLSLIEKEIPDGRNALIDSHKNLSVLSEYCKENYVNSADKTKALEETKSYASQSLSSVAYQIHSLAVNMLQMMDQQHIQLQNMQSNANNIGLRVDIHKEKVARREIGVLTSSKNFSRSHKIVPPEQPEKPHKYKREDINYSVLDCIGHGVKTDSKEEYQRRVSTSSSSGSIKAPSVSSVHSSSQGSLQSVSQNSQSFNESKRLINGPAPRPPVAPVAPKLKYAAPVASNNPPPPAPSSNIPPQPAPSSNIPPPPPMGNMPPPPMFISQPDYEGELDALLESLENISFELSPRNPLQLGLENRIPTPPTLPPSHTSMSQSTMHSSHILSPISPILSHQSTTVPPAPPPPPLSSNNTQCSSYILTHQKAPPFSQEKTAPPGPPSPTVPLPPSATTALAPASPALPPSSGAPFPPPIPPPLPSPALPPHLQIPPAAPPPPPLPLLSLATLPSASAALPPVPPPLLPPSSVTIPPASTAFPSAPPPPLLPPPSVTIPPCLLTRPAAPPPPPLPPPSFLALPPATSPFSASHSAPPSQAFPPLAPPPPPPPPLSPAVLSLPIDFSTSNDMYSLPSILPSPNDFVEDTLMSLEFNSPRNIPIPPPLPSENKVLNFPEPLPFDLMNLPPPIFSAADYNHQLPPPPPDFDELYQIPTNNTLADDLPPPPPDSLDEHLPPPYLAEESTDIKEKVIAIYDYQKLRDDELELTEGDVLFVIKKNDDGWFEGVKDGMQGLFPGNYVTPYM